MEKARRWLTVLDRNLLGVKSYLCGDQLTIAIALGGHHEGQAHLGQG